MNWQSAKTILIIFLLCTNIYMLAVLISSEYNSRTVDGDVIKAAVEVLEKNGVSISPELFSSTTQSADGYTATNVITDYEEFATKLLGEYTVSEDGVYTADNKTLRFRGDYFEYRDETLLGNTLNSAQMLVHAEELFNLIGISTEKNRPALSADNTAVSMSMELSGREFFDCVVTAEFEASGAVTVSGRWFTVEDNNRVDFDTLKSEASILMEYIGQKPEGAVSIIGMELGYSTLDEDVFHRSCELIPVIKLTTADGNEYLLDARTNEL